MSDCIKLNETSTLYAGERANKLFAITIVGLLMSHNVEWEVKEGEKIFTIPKDTKKLLLNSLPTEEEIDNYISMLYLSDEIIIEETKMYFNALLQSFREKLEFVSTVIIKHLVKKPYTPV